jgi:hypothetical protein
VWGKHTHEHTHACTRKHTNTLCDKPGSYMRASQVAQSRTRARMRACTHTNIHTRTRYTLRPTHARIRTGSHASTCADIHASTHACAHQHTAVYTHTPRRRHTSNHHLSTQHTEGDNKQECARDDRAGLRSTDFMRACLVERRSA